jgi:RNA polymerase sigma factor (sigma-70 family)
VTLDDQLATKLPLIGRVARAFIRRMPAIEFDDAVQVLSIVAWRVLLSPDEVEDVDDAIVAFGYRRLIDEMRTGRHLGTLTRSQMRIAGRPPFSLNTPISGEDDETEFIELLADPDDPYAAIADESEIADALNSLPERLHLVVWLRFFEGMKLAEIAELFEVTESRISQLVTRALIHMRYRIADVAA